MQKVEPNGDGKSAVAKEEGRYCYLKVLRSSDLNNFRQVIVGNRASKLSVTAKLVEYRFSSSFSQKESSGSCCM